ncbi:hypothetical protein QJS04_geneDACA012943 [Acorus gramineus]|uniref:Uncharacterized protein n=1 Tax=Acorus gramineus TaxID=55184 RepID=A0AAV9B105_ACOGR|nr:hypothetical protein QJS04_geneDACA012943 [Acorus gramineus]
MRRQGQYADSVPGSMATGQMQYMSAQRMQQVSGTNQFRGRSESVPAVGEEHQYGSSKGDEQWQWDNDGLKGANALQSHAYREYPGQRQDYKVALENQANKDQRGKAHEEKMEVQREENSYPQTFDGLEHKFLEDLRKLTKEQQDAEDAENARHREFHDCIIHTSYSIYVLKLCLIDFQRLSEINTQYHEKLLSIRARQATQRDEFLQRESQVRQHQFQQASMNYYQNIPGPSDPPAFGGGITETQRGYGGGHFDSYGGDGGRAGGGGRGGGQAFENKGPYPGGRAYGSGGRLY